LGRIAKPEEISPAVLYLASEEASFITGQYIVLDGGFTIQ
jgi:NAD(P)-dependent dehydrogenase (short-subunit alcohol dehydrogenase family)